MNWKAKVLLLSTKVLSLSTICVLFASSNAFAQVRPASSWNTVFKSTSECSCRLFALTEMRRAGLNTVFFDTGRVFIAANDQVIAEVACLSNIGEIHVSTFSSDIGLAQRTRERISAGIFNSQLFDTCP